MSVGRTTFALIGDPVHHSRSPAIYDAAFRFLGLEASYAARRVPRGRADLVKQLLNELAATGGGNVTVPHKQTAARHVDVRLPDAERTGAVNCFWADDSGRLVGDNTDVLGFRAAVSAADATDLADASVLLLGAGGAARAVALACLDGDAASLDVLNRTPSRAAAMIDELDIGERARVVSEAEARCGRYDLVVNATSLGLHRDDPLPLSLADMSAGFAVDLVYGRGGTTWTRHARSLGVPAQDGLSMLVRQAMLCLDRWFECGAGDRDLEAAMLGAAATSLSG